jgi:hypothetical protein
MEMEIESTNHLTNGEHSKEWKLVLNWQKSPSHFVFNTLTVGPLFSSNTPKLLFGTSDGMVRVFSNQEVF